MKYDGREYLKAFPLHTEPDKWFRYLRDSALGKERYEEAMRVLMHAHDFRRDAVMKQLWMSHSGLHELINDGHTIGLHSYLHPTTMHLLDRRSQEDEYSRNYRHLSELLNIVPESMSHPCGNYNADTLDILKSRNIRIGFRSNNSIREIRSDLEVPRQDHATVLQEMAA